MNRLATFHRRHIRNGSACRNIKPKHIPMKTVNRILDHHNPQNSKRQEEPLYCTRSFKNINARKTVNTGLVLNHRCAGDWNVSDSMEKSRQTNHTRNPLTRSHGLL